MTARSLNKALFIVFSAGCLLMADHSAAQAYEDSGISFMGAGRGDLSWCDFDNDHDLDVLVTGRGPGDQRITVLYRNDEGNFIDAGFAFIPVEESMASWGDYDGDGDKDLLLAGNSENGDITRIYRNDDGDFAEIDAGLAGTRDGTVIWVDSDNDNDLDIFISGGWLTKIYRNDNGIFTDDGQNFGYFSGTAASFGDVDNDGDFDLLINGDSGAGAVTRIFMNNAGVFEDSGIELPGLMAGAVDFVDYDLDADLDVSIAGFNDALEARYYLYKNEGKQFELVYSGIDGFALGDAEWGDYDNDGDPDLVMSGKATGCGTYVSGIYRNDQDDIFYKIPDGFTTATRCAIKLSDFDNDGDLDFIISGLNISELPFAALYRNTEGTNEFSYNTAPQHPEGLVTDLWVPDVALSWEDAVDSQSPGASITYNVKVGTTVGGNEVLASMSSSESGYHFVSSKGNAGQTNSIILYNLPEGEYFWQVQAIDQSMEASEFSYLCSFQYYTIGVESNISGNKQLTIFPNPAQDVISLSASDDILPVRVIITDVAGRMVSSLLLTSLPQEINISGLLPGQYFVKIKGEKIDYSTPLIISR